MCIDPFVYVWFLKWFIFSVRRFGVTKIIVFVVLTETKKKNCLFLYPLHIETEIFNDVNVNNISDYIKIVIHKTENK